MTLRIKDTPENRAFWKFVRKTAKYVRSHAMCFSTWCPSQDCPKAKKAKKGRV